jgi:hypothetical protein
MATIRAETIRGLVENGTSRHDAVIVADLAAHAASEAIKALMRICDTAEENLKFPAMVVAMGLMTEHLDMVFEELEKMGKVRKGR